MCYWDKELAAHVDSKTHAAEIKARREKAAKLNAEAQAAEKERQERAQKCAPASEADQSIFIEIIQPVKQEQFVSAYLAKR